MMHAKIILFLLLCAGTAGAWIYGKKAEGFHWKELFAFSFFPFVGILWYAIFVEEKILLFFFLSMVIGFVAELILGIFLEQAFGRKWWYYPRLSIAGHTSLLSLPIWGFAGTMFWLIASFIGFW